MKWIVVERLFGSTNTTMGEDLTQEEAEELRDKLDEENQDRLYRDYVACPEDPTPDE